MVTTIRILNVADIYLKLSKSTGHRVSPSAAGKRMLKIEKEEIFSFTKKYLLFFALAVCGWEASQYGNGEQDFGLIDLIEALLLFFGMFAIAVVLNSFFRGWIAFPSDSN